MFEILVEHFGSNSCSNIWLGGMFLERRHYFNFSLLLHQPNLAQSLAMALTVTTSEVPTYNQTQEWLILEDFVKNLVEDWRYQARVGNVTYTLLVLLYAAMILVGATGNILVILVSVLLRH
jgi:hypothetical protein